ncbi:ATP-NAD kinase-like domain-containing protein [Glomus cerebriforme]|uniref:ATP-NAD kinase-like domain-containing protein n=1 Tax=Glomus cerebriforme TaxID=658196 RepID=A0A397SIL7_9GLOM|nr:ATP-NAD kinase-like domain-containing protein [Glomus cerebriforme]
MAEIIQLEVKNGDKPTNLSFTDDILSFEVEKKNFKSINKLISIHSRNILSVTLDKSNDVLRVVIEAIVPKGKLKLKLKTYSFEAIDEEAVQSWINTINLAAYKDAKKAKHFKVFINPIGGSGKANKVFNKLVKPIFDAAKCTYDITMTNRSNHAKEIANKLDLKSYDAIVSVSGDGIIHEIINGLLSRNDAAEIDIPIGVIPAGTGNALSICLLGNDHGISVPHAALNIIKGVPMKIDVCSVTQGDERYFAFMSLNYGILADGDISTDHLRWMKDFRFVLGTVQALLGDRNYDCELAMKVVEDNTERIKQRYNNAYNSSSPSSVTKSKTLIDEYGTINDPTPQEWTKLNGDGYIFFASKVPWISRNNLVFPFALPSDGLLDLMVVKRDKISKTKVANILQAFNDASHVNMKEVIYYKVEALRLKPINKENGYISIDGERAEFKPFQVEVHPKLINIISMDGKYSYS